MLLWLQFCDSMLVAVLGIISRSVDVHGRGGGGCGDLLTAAGAESKRLITSDWLPVKKQEFQFVLETPWDARL